MNKVNHSHYHLLSTIGVLLIQAAVILGQNTCTHFTATEDTVSFLTSPNYPDNYDSGTRKCWILEAVDPSHHVKLETVDFRLEIDSHCTTDYLEVHQGSAEGRLIDGRHCSTRGPKITSSGRTLYLRFVSDQTKTERGFKLKFTSVQATESENDGSTMNEEEEKTESSGIDWTTSPHLHLLIIACAVGFAFLICAATVIVAAKSMNSSKSKRKKRPTQAASVASSQQSLATHIQIEHTTHNETMSSSREPSAPPIHYSGANPSSHTATLPPSYNEAVSDHAAPYMAYGNQAYS